MRCFISFGWWKTVTFRPPRCCPMKLNSPNRRNESKLTDWIRIRMKQINWKWNRSLFHIEMNQVESVQPLLFAPSIQSIQLWLRLNNQRKSSRIVNVWNWIEPTTGINSTEFSLESSQFLDTTATMKLDPIRFPSDLGRFPSNSKQFKRDPTEPVRTMLSWILVRFNGTADIDHFPNSMPI